jgi:SAM-dependent methyltransferase
LVRRAPDAQYFAVDFSLSKVRFARDRTLARTTVADGAALPFRGGTFDAVLVRDVLHYVPHRSALIAEAVRMLKLRRPSYAHRAEPEKSPHRPHGDGDPRRARNAGLYARAARR